MFRLLRGRSGALLIVALLIFFGFAAWRSLDRTGSTLIEFDEPKFMVLAVEAIPLIRDNGQPLDVMAGQPVKIICQRVSPKEGHGKARFRYDYGDGVVETLDDCDTTHAFKGAPGTIVTLDAQFLVEVPGQPEAIVDRFRSELRLVKPEPFFRIRGFGTPKNEALQGLSLPHRVIPYVDSALALDRAAVAQKLYRVAFFTQRDGEDAVYLRVSADSGGKGATAITSPLKYYRDFGAFQGLAALPDEPIALGNPDEDRVLFQVFAGLFTVDGIDALVKKCCGESAGGTVANAGLRMDEVRALAFQGLLTEPLRVVRVSGEAGPISASPAP